MKNRPFLVRLGFALNGLRCAWRTEASFRFHLAAVVALLVFVAWVRPSASWCAILALTTGAVLAAELFNTALEHLADRLHPEIHPTIKVAKDCAAGAVLVLSITAAAVFAALLVALT